MLCAECPRCRRRSIIGVNKDRLPLDDGSDPAAVKLRCDICGSKSVRVLRFRSAIEAMRYANGRG